MSSNLQNSIWPNEGGTLGQIKVQIPDGVTTPWPTGDALVNNFVYNKGKLVGFVDTKALIANSSKSTTFPYEYVNISLPSIAEGEMTYNHDQCIYFILNGEVLKGDISSDEELEIITKKYAGCKTVYDVIERDANYLTNDIVDGVWSEGLGDLEDVTMGVDEGMFRYSNLAAISSDLSSLQIGYNMFWGCSNLTTFDIELPSLTDGYRMFASCYNLEDFSSDLSSLTNGDNMFWNCNKLESFSSDLSSLTNGGQMFEYCNNLTTFTSDLPSLTNGGQMFSYCSKLESFSSDLSSLTNGSTMFYECKNLTTFTSDLPSLTNGSWMFYECNLKSFSSDLSSLTDGHNMFYRCSALTAFSSDLSSLTNGYQMFYICKLDTASVQQIADTINTVSRGTINIGIGNTEPNEQETEAFNAMVDKGWVILVNGNTQFGSSSCCATCCASLATLDENGEETVAPKPYWAKPVPSDEEHAQYVDAEGNFYNILGAQFIYGDDLSTYGMFTCEEDAAANMRLTKKGEEIMEEIETA